MKCTLKRDLHTYEKKYAKDAYNSKKWETSITRELLKYTVVYM